MHSGDENEPLSQSGSKDTENDSSKRVGEIEHDVVESKRARLANGSNGTGSGSAEPPAPGGDSAVGAAAADAVDNAGKASEQAGGQSETSVVVISEDDNGNDDDEEDADSDGDGDNEDDDDDDCQIVGVSQRVPALPRSDVEYVQHLRQRGLNPRSLLTNLLGTDMSSFQGNEDALWQLLVRLVSEPARRKRLDNVSTLDDVVVLLATCQRVMVLTGAGVSVSCGIPDFRSRDGIYSRLSREYPELPDPQSMFDIHYFRQDQRPFFKFAKEIYPNQFKPSPSHRFIRALEERGRLLRNYSQNIDTLEQVAGIARVLNCHGSFATASCMRCGHKVQLEFIKEDIMNERIPMCPVCTRDGDGEPGAPALCEGSKGEGQGDDRPGPSTSVAAAAPATGAPEAPAPASGAASSSASASASSQPEARPVLKPDIVFFGESLPSEFYDCVSQDEGQADLLIVMGSSLKVQPVSLIPNSLPGRVPQILINREPLHQHNFDVCLLGDCDRIVAELCRRLGWEGVVDQDGGGESAVSPLREIRGEELLARRRMAYAAEAASGASASASAPTTASAGPSTTSTAAAATALAAAEAAASGAPHEEEDDCNISAYLPAGTYARFPPNKYVFPGAEAHPDEICSDEDEDDLDGVGEDEEEEEEGDFDDEEFDSETVTSSSDGEQPQIVVNLISSEEEDVDEEEERLRQVEVEAEDAALRAAAAAREVDTAEGDANLPPAKEAPLASTSVSASASASGGGDLGDAEEEELLNCDVD